MNNLNVPKDVLIYLIRCLVVLNNIQFLFINFICACSNFLMSYMRRRGDTYIVTLQQETMLNQRMIVYWLVESEHGYIIKHCGRANTNTSLYIQFL